MGMILAKNSWLCGAHLFPNSWRPNRPSPLVRYHWDVPFLPPLIHLPAHLHPLSILDFVSATRVSKPLLLHRPGTCWLVPSCVSSASTTSFAVHWLIRWGISEDFIEYLGEMVYGYWLSMLTVPLYLSIDWSLKRMICLFIKNVAAYCTTKAI